MIVPPKIRALRKAILFLLIARPQTYTITYSLYLHGPVIYGEPLLFNAAVRSCAAGSKRDLY